MIDEITTTQVIRLNCSVNRAGSTVRHRERRRRGALGLAVIVVLGEIDISVASILAFGAVLFSKFSEAGLAIWFAAPCVVFARPAGGVSSEKP